MASPDALGKQFIEPRLYRKISSRVPIICVDMIVTDERGRYLLVRRKNHPLRGQWWVVGGRVLLGEHPEDAAHRKVFEEVGRHAVGVRFAGYLSDTFERNRFERCECHTISVVFKCAIEYGAIKLDSQSSNYKWADALPERFLERLAWCDGICRA